MTRYHDRNFFFKYVTKEAARLIIKDHKLRWSCPLDFTDPFDHQFAFIDEDIESLTKEFMQRLQEYVWDRDDIQFDISDDPFGFGRILTLLKRMKNRITREKFVKQIEEIMPQWIESGRQAYKKYNEDIKLFLLQTRVLCLAEENDNLLMWAHYSAGHTGAVLKLNAIDELDVSLLAAKKVRYSTTYPLVATREEWIRHLLYVKRIDFRSRYADLFYIKGEDWHYEEEWRLSMTREDYPLGGAIYLKEPVQVFGAIYLGCRMPKEDKKQILELSKQSLPNMEIWQAVQGKMDYKIDFERLK